MLCAVRERAHGCAHTNARFFFRLQCAAAAAASQRPCPYTAELLFLAAAAAAVVLGSSEQLVRSSLPCPALPYLAPVFFSCHNRRGSHPLHRGLWPVNTHCSRWQRFIKVPVERPFCWGEGGVGDIHLRIPFRWNMQCNNSNATGRGLELCPLFPVWRL